MFFSSSSNVGIQKYKKLCWAGQIDRMCLTEFCGENLENGHFEDQARDRSLRLKWVLERKVAIMGCGWNWLRGTTILWY